MIGSLLIQQIFKKPILRYALCLLFLSKTPQLWISRFLATKLHFFCSLCLWLFFVTINKLFCLFIFDLLFHSIFIFHWFLFYQILFLLLIYFWILWCIEEDPSHESRRVGDQRHVSIYFFSRHHTCLLRSLSQNLHQIPSRSSWKTNRYFSSALTFNPFLKYKINRFHDIIIFFLWPQIENILIILKNEHNLNFL